MPPFFRPFGGFGKAQSGLGGQREKTYASEPERVLVKLLHNRVLGPELKRAVSEAKCISVTWVCLEDYLREQRSRADSLLSQTLKTECPRSSERMLIYYWKVVPILDAPERMGIVGNSITPDQL